MLKNRLKNPVFLVYLLAFYIIIQFSAWLYLIFKLSQETYIDKETLIKKIWMLIGEGSVFLIILILGIIAIRRAIKKEQEFNSFQENFLLSITHELKTPISSVKLYLQTLSKRTLSDEQKNKIYSESLGEINRLDALVSNILMTRSIENNNYFLDKKSFRLDQFITGKIEALNKTMLSQFEINLDLAEITADFDQIAFDSIISNLLENATKYSPINSTISIQLYQDAKHNHLVISDQGHGIEKSKQKNVFKKFYRVENEMTRRSKGTGLGLFITKHLVNAHNGKIEIRNNNPKGTIVHIKFKL